MSIQAMKTAIEAMQPQDGYNKKMTDAITALRAAIEQAEKAEPVAEVTQEDINQIVWLAPSLGVGRGSKLYASKPQPQQPEGWQLVPVEPTPKMLKEILVAYPDAMHYKAMLQAAPKEKP